MMPSDYARVKIERGGDFDIRANKQFYELDLIRKT